MIRVSDTIAACRDLGYVCRFDHTTGEYRLARPTTHWRGYTRKHQLAMQELWAYYDSDPHSILSVARDWALYAELASA